MKKVDFYRVEVKYTGDLEDYTIDEIKVIALSKVYKGVDGFDHTEEREDDKAERINGRYWLENDRPCNHLIDVCWAYIQEVEEDAEEI